jgi:predicted XRE-type DNA-binding protein
MMEIAHRININLPAKLQNKDYRQKFFLAESAARLAEQITALRKRRGLNQKQLAEMVDTKQPAISRVEQADYQNWNFGTLRNIVSALDGRIRVLIEASEDVLPEYEKRVESDEAKESAEPVGSIAGIIPNLFAFANVTQTNWEACQFGWMGLGRSQSQLVNAGVVDQLTQMANQLSQKDAEIAQLKSENLALKTKIISETDYQVRFHMPFGAAAQISWLGQSVQQ